MPAAERRWLWPAAVVALVLGALALRLYGVRHGLPYVYNADENAHFVAGAIGMFGHTYNPNYFINPPAFTYLLHAAFQIGFGGRVGVSKAYAADPGDVQPVLKEAPVPGTAHGRQVHRLPGEQPCVEGAGRVDVGAHELHPRGRSRGVLVGPGHRSLPVARGPLLARAGS